MSQKILRPGNKVPISGQYIQVGPRGGVTKNEITGVKGKILPATPTPKMTYRLVDRTK